MNLCVGIFIEYFDKLIAETSVGACDKYLVEVGHQKYKI